MAGRGHLGAELRAETEAESRAETEAESRAETEAEAQRPTTALFSRVKAKRASAQASSNVSTSRVKMTS